MSEISAEAIEAAARELAAMDDQLGNWNMGSPNYHGVYRRRAQRVLTAAAPLIAAQAKGEALREAADACAPDYETTDTRSVAKWLRARAAAIEPTA